MSQKPCGVEHPLPCGLDIRCPVPSEYWEGKKTNKEIVEEYE
jgi:hypothetical protein